MLNHQLEIHVEYAITSIPMKSPILIYFGCSILHYRFTLNFPSRQDLLDEMQWGLENVYYGLEEDFPMVLAHNDAHILNIIYNQQKGRWTIVTLLILLRNNNE